MNCLRLEALSSSTSIMRELRMTGTGNSYSSCLELEIILTLQQKYIQQGWFKSHDQALNCLIQLHKRMSVLNEMYNRLIASGMFIEMPVINIQIKS